MVHATVMTNAPSVVTSCQSAELTLAAQYGWQRLAKSFTRTLRSCAIETIAGSFPVTVSIERDKERATPSIAIHLYQCKRKGRGAILVPMASDTNKKALILHKKLGGKMRSELATPVRNRADLSLVYTPGVAAVSLHVAKHPAQARAYTGKGRTIAVVSDGSAVLGLGNIGPLGALPVMEGKCMIFKSFGGVDAVPLVLDVHTTDEIVAAVKAIAPGFGGINLEDIAAPQCFD
jgi:hypothetical protein